MVRQRSWWIVGLLVVTLFGAAIVAWRWLGDESAPAAKGDGPTRAARPAPAGDLSDATKTAPSADVQREAEPPPPDDPNSARELPAGAAVKYGIPMTVVRHEDGLPIGGAQLVVLDARRVQREEIATLARDLSELRRRASFWLRTDKTGLAQVPRPVAAAFVVGIADGRRGSTRVTAATFGSQRLELFPPREVGVQVVDEQGLPQAGIEVALAEADRSFLDSSLRATTDEKGNAKLADLELEESMQSARRKFAVGFAFLQLPPVSVAVELDPPPPEPLVLTLPATGSIAFQVVDSDGEPLAVAGSLQLAAATTAELLDDRRRRRGGAELQSTRVDLDKQGRGTVARVGLSLQFKATPELPERLSAPQRFAGPTHARESVDVALPADAIGPLLTGRVVGSGEMPLAGADLRAQLDSFADDGRLFGSDRADATIGGDGSFRLDFSRSGLKERECQLFLRATREGRSAAEAKTTVKLPATGIQELGTIRLAPPPLLVSGLVVDDDATPIEAASVRITAELDPPIPFKVNHLPAFTTEADGTFELRGEVPDGELSLHASRSGYLPSKSQPFVIGAREVTLILRMGGTLAGSLVLPDGFANDLLNARLHVPGSWPPIYEVQPVRADGLFRFPLLATGLWEFELLLGRDVENAEPITVVRQVAIHPFELTRDPRLQDLDLLALVRVVEATVRVSGGALAEKGAVGRPAAGRNGRSQLSVPLKDGRALVPCTSVPVDLQIVVPGFLAQTAHGVSGPVDVLMRRGLPVHVVVSGRLERQPDWIPVRVTARPRDEALAAVAPGETVPVAANEASLVLPAAGRYRARIEFAPPPDPNSPADSRRRVRGMRSEVDFDVKDVDREQSIELKVKR